MLLNNLFWHSRRVLPIGSNFSTSTQHSEVQLAERCKALAYCTSTFLRSVIYLPEVQLAKQELSLAHCTSRGRDFLTERSTNSHHPFSYKMNGDGFVY